jgi:3D (Asp-Asp-Asp) domain-containing protein
MRRNATRLNRAVHATHAKRFLPLLVVLLVVTVAGAIGRADARKPASNLVASRMIYRWPDPVKVQIFQALPHARPVLMEVTAYCPCTKCCGKEAHGVTASGRLINHNHGRFVAADTSLLPFGTRLVIPGYSNGPVEVVDRGGAIKGNKLDVFFPTHDEARQWGRRWVEVIISPS